MTQNKATAEGQTEGFREQLVGNPFTSGEDLTLLKDQWGPLEGSDGVEPSDWHLAVRDEQVGSKGGHRVRPDANAVAQGQRTVTSVWVTNEKSQQEL